MMGRKCGLYWVIVIMLHLAAAGAFAAEPTQIDLALQRARDYLYKAQKDGNWERADRRDATAKAYELDGGQWGGITALCTYALLAAGESHEDPHLKPAIQFLLDAKIAGTYAVAMRCQVWNSLPKSPQIRQAIQRDAQFLRQAMYTRGAARGFYDYTDQGEEGTRIDHSASQYAVLGAWACAENLDSFGTEYWRIVDEAWRSTQHDAGSWSYERAPNKRYPATVAMTAAGVATLFLTQDFLNRGRPQDPRGNLNDPSIDKGIKWIGEHYADLLNADGHTQYYPYYGLFGVERIGLASGYKYLGKVNWYDDGADFLVKDQNKNGGFGGTINTALAVLFLSRGRAPLVMSKLQYELTAPARSGAGSARSVEANWNQRPRDAANLVKFIGRGMERELNWQTIDFKAPIDELLDSPILYISGNQAVSFTTEQKLKLKQYVLQGGLLLAHADSSSLAFGNSMKKLAVELFGYEFRALPAGHPIYTAEQYPYANWKRKPSVLAMSNGVRELVILLPDADPARFWQSYDTAAHPEMFEFVANVFQYAVDKQNLRNRGQRHAVARSDAVSATRSMKIARLRYAGNWDPEPAGWPRLAGIMHNEQKIDLDLRELELRDLSLETPIAHLTGTDSITLDEASRDALKAYVNHGGVLVVDAAGGSARFQQSIESELDTIFGDEAKSLRQPLPADAEVYRMNGGRIEITYRQFARRNLTGDLKTGRLRAMLRNDRPAIVYSPEDLSAGLTGAPVDGVPGYDPATASKLMINILLQGERSIATGG